MKFHTKDIFIGLKFKCKWWKSGPPMFHGIGEIIKIENGWVFFKYGKESEKQISKIHFRKAFNLGLYYKNDKNDK